MTYLSEYASDAMQMAHYKLTIIIIIMQAMIVKSNRNLTQECYIITYILIPNLALI